MDASLERYLNDHLAGSAGAVDLIQTLADGSEVAEEKQFFHGLRMKVEEDRKMLKSLLEKVNRTDSTVLQFVGNLTAKVGRLKWVWEGLEPGRLGNFEALEMLAIGVHGKRLLWVMLREISPWIPEWREIPFADLELEAIAQRDSIEVRRLEAGKEALVNAKRRTGNFPVSPVGE